ncbi:hypothetical protein FRC17_008328, partial [Serendipita sp. 399]
PCEEQLCPRCATSDQKAQVVDLLLHSTLEEVDLEGTDLDCVLITLRCKHVFTVETLDGVCGLGDYYERQEGTGTDGGGGGGGHWIRSLLPPPGTIKAPVCPQCRGEITSPRYGRVLKRCHLDLLERTVATDTAMRIQQLQGLVRMSSLGGPEKEEMETRLCAHLVYRSDESPNLADTVRVRQVYQQKLQSVNMHTATVLTNQKSKDNEKREGLIVNSLPFALEDFAGSMLAVAYGLPRSMQVAMDGVFREVWKVYGMAYKIAEGKSAHTRAYESGLARLYRREMDRLVQQGAAAGEEDGNGNDNGDNQSSLQERALESAKVAIGMTAPLADRRFQVESVWMLIELRLVVASVVGGTRVYAKVVKDEWDHRPSALSTTIAGIWKVINPFGSTTMTTTTASPSTPSDSASNANAGGGGMRAERVRSFVEFVYASCLLDVALAIRIARESGARRQVLMSELKGMR